MMMRFATLALIAVPVLVAAVPASAEPIEYVRICSAFGAGYYYEPGSDTCINADTGVTKRYRYGLELTGQTSLADQVDDQQHEIDGLNQDVQNLRAGVAAAAALPRPYVDPGHKFAVAGDWGQYDGEHAFGVGGAFRLDENWTFSGSAAIPVDGGGVATRAGFNVSW